MRFLLSCIAASLFSFYNLYLFSLMNVLGIHLVHDLQITPSQLGFLGACDLWGNVLGFLPIGLMLDKFNSRRVGLPLLGLAILSAFLMGFATNFYTLTILRFFQGLASAGSLLITMRIGNYIPRHANKVIGLMVLIALSGGLLGNIGFSYLASRMGWRSSLILTALFGLVLLGISYLWLQDTKVTTFPRISLKTLVNKHSFWAGCHIGLLNLPVFLLGTLFGNYFLMQGADFSLAQATFISGLLFVGIMAASPFFGYLADKIKSIPLIFIGYTGLSFLFILLVLKPNLSFTSYGVIFFLIGCFCSTQNLIYPLLYKKKIQSPSTYTAITAIVFNSLGALLQLSFGFVLQGFIHFEHLIFLFFPLLYIIAMFCLI